MLCLIYTYLPLGAVRPWALCVYIRQSTVAYVITYTYTHIYMCKSKHCRACYIENMALVLRWNIAQRKVECYTLFSRPLFVCHIFHIACMSIGNRLFSTAQCPTTLLLCTLLMCFIKISRHLCLRIHLNFKYTFSQRGYHVPLLQE